MRRRCRLRLRLPCGLWLRYLPLIGVPRSIREIIASFGKLSIANSLKFVPFLLAPFIDNPWFYVFAFGFYMMLTRGMIPSWMEVLKKNVQGMSMERVFAYGSAFEYIGGAILPLAFGFLLDMDGEVWRYIFPVTALVGMSVSHIY